MSGAPALRAPRRRAVGPEPAAQSQPFGRSSTGATALPFKPLPQTPNAVQLLGYEDYRRIFMPIGWEYADQRRAAGDHSYLTGVARGLHDRHVARLWAGNHAVIALNRPGQAAAAAIGFFARQMLGEGFHISEREAAE